MMIEDVYDIIRQLDFSAFLYFFWFFIIFDAPRYIFSLISVAISALAEPFQKAQTFSGPISILLVGHNEGHALRRCIETLQEQTHQDYEIIVVDDGSSDNSHRIAMQLKREGKINHFLSTTIRGGKASALNLGFRYCRHPIIVSMDIDTSIARDAIEEIIKPFSDESVGAVAGNLSVRNRETNLLTQLQAIEYLLSISMGRRFTSMMGILAIVSGAFGAYRKSAVTAVGGWDVGPGDDGNLTNKVRRSGWQIRFAHRAWALTDVPSSIMAYTRQRLRWSRSTVRYKMRKFSSAFDPRHKNFSGSDILALANIIFFQVILSISFFSYLIWLFYELGPAAFLIIAITTTIYVIEDAVTFLVAAIIYREHNAAQMGVYLIAYSLFSSYLARAIRLAAYIDEFIFRNSYKDSFVPKKVRDKLERF